MQADLEIVLTTDAKRCSTNCLGKIELCNNLGWKGTQRSPSSRLSAMGKEPSLEQVAYSPIQPGFEHF